MKVGNSLRVISSSSDFNTNAFAYPAGLHVQEPTILVVATGKQLTKGARQIGTPPPPHAGRGGRLMRLMQDYRLTHQDIIDC